MARESIQSLILREVQGLREDMNAVRQTDIPNLRIKVEGFKAELKAVQSRQTWYSSIATVVGGALAVMVSTFTGHK